MHEIVVKAACQLVKVRTFHHDLYSFLSSIDSAVRDSRVKINQGDRADLAFFAKQIGEQFDDLRKESNKLRDLLDNLICLAWVKEFEKMPGKKGPIRGSFCTCTPDVKMAPRIPKRSDDPEAYSAILKELGVSGESVDDGLVRLHWPSLVDHFSALLAAGKPVPKGINIDFAIPVYRTTLRKTKESEELLESTNRTTKALALIAELDAQLVHDTGHGIRAYLPEEEGGEEGE